jgi:drug/metabolite transporter (DMT)-like permease
MAVSEMSVTLALIASLAFGLQAHAVEMGMDRAREIIDRTPALTAAYISIVVSAVLFWSFVWIRGAPSLSLDALWPFLVAGVAYPGAFRLLYFEGIDRVGSSVAAAIVAANPALSAILAVWFLDEKLTPLVGIGVFFIVGGGVLLQLAYNTATSDGDVETDVVLQKLRQADLTDLLYPAGAFLCIGSGYVVIKFGLNRFPDAAVATATAQTAAFVVFTALIAVSGNAREELRDGVRTRFAVGTFVVAGVFVAVAWLSQFFALQFGTVIVVTPLVNSYPLVIVVIAYGLSRSVPRSPYVLTGVISIIVGAVLIGLS